MLKLYEIDAQIEQLNDQIEQYASEHDGEIPESLDNDLMQLQLNRDEKISGIAKWIKSLNAEYDAVDTEYKCLKARRDAIGNRIESIKKYLAFSVGVGQKFKDAAVSIYWKTSESVNVVEPEKLPTEYQNITITANKTAIKEALKTGRIQESDNIKIETKDSIVIR